MLRYFSLINYARDKGVPLRYQVKFSINRSETALPKSAEEQHVESVQCPYPN